MVYDLRGRLVSTQTFRSKPSWWGVTGALPASGSPANYRAPMSADPVQQLILESRNVTYDAADNPVLIAGTHSPLGAAEWNRMGCGRTASEWPAGSKPVTKRMTYDDAYRILKTEYLNPNGASATAGTATTHTWIDPFDAEARTTALVTSASTATANPKPAPHVKLPARVKAET